jgi:hypothetical protein
MTRSRSAAAVFKDHLRLRQRGALEKDLSRNFSDEVVLLTACGVYRGHDGIRRLARLLQEQLPCATFEYRTKLVEGEVAFLEWAARCPKAEVRDGADSFLIRDGKIVAQTIHYTVQALPP